MWDIIRGNAKIEKKCLYPKNEYCSILYLEGSYIEEFSEVL